ncbi:hypothetical protein CRG98_014378 [Punica granatum]|uniref:Uncharacterized protein n=1 Tax=Punica granatum TaxID=22663 RepID=A0A2I0K9K5_PUNGR|nr:hypothetical protein CRG98_014378 [Punica granatum]
MAKFIDSIKEQALKYAQIGKPKSPAEINRRIYTGLGPDWEPIVLDQSERMLTMYNDELQSLLEFSTRLQKSTIPVAASTKEVAEIEAGRETVKEGNERAKEVARTVGGSSLVKDRTERALFTLIRRRVNKVNVSGRTDRNFRVSGRPFIPDSVMYMRVKLATRVFLLAPFQTGPTLEPAVQCPLATPHVTQPSPLGPDLWSSVRCVTGPVIPYHIVIFLELKLI